MTLLIFGNIRVLSEMNKIFKKIEKKREIFRGDVELTTQNQQLECGGASETKCQLK